MSKNKPAELAEIEAAAWYARLGERRVTTQTIEDFFAWRAVPANAEAYRRVETVWAETGKISGSQAVADAIGAAMTRKGRGGGRQRRRRQPRFLIGVGAVAAAVALVVAVGIWQESRTIYSTHVGEQRLVQLADGSTVRLDTGSRIRVRFAADQRLIELEGGQALFTVSHDAERPFVVQAGDTRVQALGTVFDVRREGADVRVTLVSGVVEVAESGVSAPRRLSAGQQAVRTPDGVATRPVDVATETSWIDGRIVFQDTPLREAVSEVNRYLTAKIELEPGAMDGATVNGVFRTGDREAFVSTASAVLDLRVSEGPAGSVRLSAAENN